MQPHVAYIYLIRSATFFPDKSKSILLFVTLLVTLMYGVYCCGAILTDQCFPHSPSHYARKRYQEATQEQKVQERPTYR